MSDSKAEALMRRYSVPVVKQFLAKNKDQAVRAAKKLGFPVVMKISSPDILHKTESKGIVVGVEEHAVGKTFEQLITRAKRKRARIDGVLLQEQVTGREVIIGGKQDPSFGPVIMFGLGGIFVEVLKDVVFRLAPLERKDARSMIREIKGFSILQGVRGEKPINFKKLEDVLLNVSKLLWKNNIKELDINPLFVNEKQALAADVRILT